LWPEQLVINVDNWPECTEHCTQFLWRLIEFADFDRSIRSSLPSISQYNGIERYLAGLENWVKLKWVSNFYWKGLPTVTRLLDMLTINRS
jgi:hypothetical protein